MSHRTQITLEDEQYERLIELSRETGLGLAELIRQAVDERYGRLTPAQRAARLDVAFGGWSVDYERPTLRGSGLADRVERLGQR